MKKIIVAAIAAFGITAFAQANTTAAAPAPVAKTAPVKHKRHIKHVKHAAKTAPATKGKK